MKKYKFLFVSYVGLIGDIAWQVSKEGHEVKYCIEDKSAADSGDGFLTEVDRWENEVDWADVVVFDQTCGYGKKAENLRKRGKLVVGGTQYTDRLEDDRAFGQNELKRHNIPILPYEEFTDFDVAIEYVKRNPGAYVIKPSGESLPKQLVFVGSDPKGNDVIQMLGLYKKSWAHLIKAFQLQKKVLGVEMCIGGFFNGKKFVNKFNIGFEHKKLFPSDLGPSTGEMGTSSFWSGPNYFYTLTMQKFEATLREVGYVGYFDINCIVNGDGVYPLEFTCRFGYPCISIQEESIDSPFGQFLYDLAAGNDIKLKVKKGFQIGVRVVLPPFPYPDQKMFDKYSKNAIILFRKPDLRGVHIEDVKIVDGEWVATGTYGTTLIVVGCGSTIRAAQKQAYDRIRNIMIPNMYYRNDIGERWYVDAPRLKKWGYLKPASTASRRG